MFQHKIQMIDRTVINLDSDDEIKHCSDADNPTIPVESVIEILSDSSNISDNEAVLSTKRPEVSENCNTNIRVTEEPLTPQLLMRQKLAEAAENRLKRGHDDHLVDNASSKRTKQNLKSTPRFSKPSEKTWETKSTINDRSSRIRMIANPTYCSEFGVDGDKDAVSLSDLVGSKDLRKTYQFNMLIDFDYLCQFVTAKDCQFVLVNNCNDDYLHVKDESWEKYKIQTIDVSNRLPKFGSHHTKLMINFFKDDSCQIVVHTMNLTQADHVIQTQMCWISPQLYLHKNPNDYLDFNRSDVSLIDHTGVAFKRDFIAYLMTYQNNDINRLIDQIGKYDFEPIDVVFVASSPGHYRYDEWETLKKATTKPMFGYGRLWQVIHMLDLQCLSGQFIGQTSTIAGPCDNWKRNTLVHLLTSCVEKGYPLIKKADYDYRSGKCKVQPILIWPTTKEVLSSKAGPLSGIALHLTSKGKWAAYQRQFDDIKKYFYKWTKFSASPKLSRAGRSNLSPHVKTYTVTEDNFKTLKWMLLTSANISHQAWGKSVKYNTIEYDISSFEAGIFIAPKLLKVPSNTNKDPQILVPTFGQDTTENQSTLSQNKCRIGLRLPYDVPLEKYTNDDIAWSQPDSDKYF